ncbi:WD40 repeat domain-containing protein [Catellatospora tritici]|uniref:WD40 repeat domain-containing protein n=1 Tax=Catellatospora tritici TaxID=2851566 RepID=UPI001C2CD390|nr:hypothetical protein [Catellatospora tritici]MBV1853047.1 hypothetical protein [Catellatospora tritici]
MTAALRDALHQVADDSPPVQVATGLFDRALRARRRRRLAGLAAAVALASSVMMGAQLPVRPHPVASGDTIEQLPALIVQAPTWTADIEHAPLPRVLVAFDGDIYNEYMPDESTGDGGPHPIGPLTLVGPRDQYRSFDLSRADAPWDGTVLLSPDGRYVMTGHAGRTQLLDVTTGRSRMLEAGSPLAFSPDGRQAVLVHWDRSGYPVSGELRVVAVPTGEVAWSAPLADGPLPREVDAALSPDGSTLAVQRHGDFYTYRRGVGVGWHRTLDGELAGQLAWTPDGKSIAANDGFLCLVDAKTGATGRCISWQSMLPRMPVREQTFGPTTVLAWEGDVPIIALPRDVVRMTEVPELLMRTPRGTGALAVSTSRVSWNPRQPGPPDPGPAIDRFRPLIDGAGLVVGGLVLVYAVVRLRRRARGRSSRA